VTPAPADLPGAVKDLSDVFTTLRISHAFGGAIAQNYWGTVRATQDIDLLASIPRIRFQEVAETLDAAGFRAAGTGKRDAAIDVAAMVAEERDRHLFTIHRRLVKVEIFLPFLPIQTSILERAVSCPFEDKTIRVTSAEDLVLLKMVFHREKDLRDVRAILLNQRGKLDLAYIRDGAGKLLENPRVEELEAYIARYGTAG